MAQKYFGTYIKLNRELVKVWNDTVTLYNKIRVKGKRITREDCLKFFEELSEIASKRRHLEDLLYKYRLQDKKVAKEYVDKYKISKLLPFFVNENTYLETVVANIKLIIDEYIKPLLRKYCIKEVPPPPPPKAKSRIITFVGGYDYPEEKAGHPGRAVYLDITIKVSVPLDFDANDFKEKVEAFVENWHIANGFYNPRVFDFSIGIEEETLSDAEPIGLLEITVIFSKKNWEYLLELDLTKKVEELLWW